MYELVRQIWEEERISEEWKETIIVPIHRILRNKKDVIKKLENYTKTVRRTACFLILS